MKLKRRQLGGYDDLDAWEHPENHERVRGDTGKVLEISGFANFSVPQIVWRWDPKLKEYKTPIIARLRTLYWEDPTHTEVHWIEERGDSLRVPYSYETHSNDKMLCLACLEEEFGKEEDE